MGNGVVGMDFRDAVAVFQHRVYGYDLRKVCQHTGREIDPAVDLGVLPAAVYRQGLKAVFRLPSIAEPCLTAVQEGFKPPAFADLPVKVPSLTEVKAAESVFVLAAAAFCTEVAATAPRRRGSAWYHADVSGGFPPSSLPLLEKAREAMAAYALIFVAWAIKEGVL